jgi:hypothetical protein
MILDLSFVVRQVAKKKGRQRSRQEEQILQDSVKDTTVRLAPEGPVKELGNVLPQRGRTLGPNQRDSRLLARWRQPNHSAAPQSRQRPAQRS